MLVLSCLTIVAVDYCPEMDFLKAEIERKRKATEVLKNSASNDNKTRLALFLIFFLISE